MWAILALVMSLALFAMLSFMHMEQSENTVMHAEERSMEVQSAQQMNTFASAAWAYATAQSVGSGTSISVAQLISAGYLPTGFSATNPFGQTIVAVAGNKTLAAYYQNPPSTILGQPVNAATESGVALRIAAYLAAMQENTPQFVAAVSSNGGSGSYTQALLPYNTSPISMSGNDPQFSTSFPSLLDLVGVLP